MRRRCLEERRQGIPRALTPACGRVPREVSPISYISPFTLFSNPKSERFRQGWIGVGRSCLYLRYRRNYRKLLSSEILKLTQGEETEEGRTNFRSGVQRGDDGEPRAIEFLFQKLETRSFLEFPSPQEQGCKALQQGCRSGAEAQAAASKLGQPANCIPNARRALWSAQLRPFSSRRSCRRPCCLFQPLGGHRQNPALLSIFFFFLPLPGCLPTHYLYIQIKRRSPFLLGLAGVGQEQRAVPASPPLTMPGDSFFGSPSQKPTLVRLAPDLLPFGFIVPCQFHFVIHKAFCLGRGGVVAIGPPFLLHC